MYSASRGFLISITSCYKVIITNPRCHVLTCTVCMLVEEMCTITGQLLEQHRVGRSGCRQTFLHNFIMVCKTLHVWIPFQKPNLRMSGSNQSQNYSLPAQSILKPITLNIVQFCFFENKFGISSWYFSEVISESLKTRLSSLHFICCSVDYVQVHGFVVCCSDFCCCCFF